MTVGFFVVLRTDPEPYLHAAALVVDVRRVMPGVDLVQLTDTRTPEVPGITTCQRIESSAPLLDQRLGHYAQCAGDWLFLDTDVAVLDDVRGVFADQTFDVALTDRVWPHLPQGDAIMQTMPFNLGVSFSRCPSFWGDVLARWRTFDAARQANWMSDQAALYDIVRTGRYHVKILPGLVYNYPPMSLTDVPASAALLHYKGPRKMWLSQMATTRLGQTGLSQISVD